MKKVLAGIVASLLMASSVFALSPLPPLFDDVTASSDYYQAIEWMRDNNVIGGYSDGTFRPDSCVNRVEFIKMLFASRDVSVSSYPTVYFNDTDPNAWYAAYLNAAVARGAVEGYPDGTFRPENCVNRVEAMKMAIEEFNFEPEPLPGMGWSYADVDTREWYIEYFYIAIRDSLVGREHEYSNQSIDSPASRYFYPGEGMTRKEVAEMLYRMKAVVDNYADEYSSGIYPRDLNLVSSYCTDAPVMTDIGRAVYPIKPYYEELPFLGQLFTAFECGPERVDQIFGVVGDYYTLGSRINIDINANDHSPYLIEELEKVGYTCREAGVSSSSCTEWVLNDQVKVGDIVKVRNYTGPIISEDCVNCG